jgi:hypothetical protein
MQLMGFFSAEGVQWTDSAENPYQINNWGASFIVFGSNPPIDNSSSLRQHFSNFRVVENFKPVSVSPTKSASTTGVSQSVSKEGSDAQTEQSEIQKNPPPPEGVSLPSKGDIVGASEITRQQIEKEMRDKTGNKDVTVQTTRAEIDQNGDRHAEWKIDDPTSDAKTQTIKYDRSPGLGAGSRDRVSYQEGLVGEDNSDYDTASEDIGDAMKSTADSSNLKEKRRGW